MPTSDLAANTPALFMVDAVTNPALVHEAPAIVGRLSASAPTVAA